MNIKKNEQLISIPLADLVWNILGDDSNGVMCSKITPLTAQVLQVALKDSLLWKVEFYDKDGKELEIPILWRYSEWKSSSDTYARQKLFSHKQRVSHWIHDKNIDNLAKEICKSTKMDMSMARPIAASIINKGSMEVFKVLGLNKLITKEEEL